MKKYKIEKHNKTYQVMLQVSAYRQGNLAIQMMVELDGKLELWNTLTINFQGHREHNCAFIDTSNNGQDILAWIIRHGFAVPTGRKIGSGFCEYPEYRFREKALREMDENGYIKYCKNAA